MSNAIKYQSQRQVHIDYFQHHFLFNDLKFKDELSNETKVSKYKQAIPQSHTADLPTSHRTLAVTRHQEYTFRSQTCKCKKGSDWLKRWVEAQHNIFKL